MAVIQDPGELRANRILFITVTILKLKNNYFLEEHRQNSIQQRNLSELQLNYAAHSILIKYKQYFFLQTPRNCYFPHVQECLSVRKTQFYAR